MNQENASKDATVALEETTEDREKDDAFNAITAEYQRRKHTAQTAKSMT